MTPPSLKRIAIIDHYSAGGVSRFLFALIANMARLHPETAFGYFVSEANVKRDDLFDAFQPYANVTVLPIRSPIPPDEPAVEPGPEPQERGLAWRTSVGLLKKMPRVHSAMKGAYVAARERISPTPQPSRWYDYGLDQTVLTQIAEYDVAYIGWPYWIEPFDTSAPVVATFHDFHYKHFPEAYEPERLERVERQIPEWLRRCTIGIVSTKFIQSDLLHYYGEVAPPSQVVYIAPYGLVTPSAEVIDETIETLGVRRPFVLYSGALTAHKNVVSLVRAIALARDAGASIQLVITGHCTDLIGRSAAEDLSEEVQTIDRAIEETGLRAGIDYLALGYVSNTAVDALTASADAVVSASLYEAGCGPALDAWQMGVPVAFSSIPPFVEQMERFGVEAHVFDPHDPADIAAKLRDAVFDTERSHAMAERSRLALQRYTWDDAAQGYYDVFVSAAELSRGDAGRSIE